MIGRIRNVGDSFGVILPKRVMNLYGWKKDEPVTIEVSSEKILIEKFQTGETK